MKKLLRILLLFIIVFALFFGFIANDRQRSHLNDWYKVTTRPLQQLGIKLPKSLLPPELDSSGEPSLSRLFGHNPDFCSKSNTVTPTTYRIYQWRDSNNQLKIGDRPPTKDYTNLQIKEMFFDNFFDLSLDTRLATLPAFFRNNIQAGVTKVYKTLRDTVKVAQLRKVQLKLKFISNENGFQQYRRDVMPNNENIVGFYSPKLNEATILAYENEHEMIRVTLHESTHAILSNMFGDVPIWLSEGLAEFFENMSINGQQTYIFSTNDEHLQLLRYSHLPPLTDHLKQTVKEWQHPNNISLNYAIDWSLIFYLMTQPQGRELLRYMLDRLAVNYCQPFASFDAVDFINEHYDGGIDKLNTNWRIWMKTVPSGKVTFY